MGYLYWLFPPWIPGYIIGIALISPYFFLSLGSILSRIKGDQQPVFNQRIWPRFSLSSMKPISWVSSSYLWSFPFSFPNVPIPSLPVLHPPSFHHQKLGHIFCVHMRLFFSSIFFTWSFNDMLETEHCLKLPNWKKLLLPTIESYFPVFSAWLGSFLKKPPLILILAPIWKPANTGW